VKIWLVIESWWESDGVVAAFSEEAAARAEAARRSAAEKGSTPTFDIKEIVVDELLIRVP
jgi:hypothetical protein